MSDEVSDDEGGGDDERRGQQPLVSTPKIDLKL
jgi:hypothetical protein